MSRILVRRAPEDAVHRTGTSLGSILIGAAVAGGLAFLVHQIWSAANEEAWQPGRPLPRKPSSPAITAARAALATDPHLSEAGLTLLAGGRGTIELHGWVADRGERTRAAKLVSAAIAPIELVNSILVHGEDDGEELDEDLFQDAASA